MINPGYFPNVCICLQWWPRRSIWGISSLGAKKVWRCPRLCHQTWRATGKSMDISKEWEGFNRRILYRCGIFHHVQQPEGILVSPPVMSQKLPETCLMICVCSDFLMLFVLWILMVLRIMFFCTFFNTPKIDTDLFWQENQRLRGWRTRTATSWRTRGGFGRLERKKKRRSLGIETSEMEV